MNGLTTNNMTLEQVKAAVRSIPPGNDFVWDGVDEDDRPLTKEEMRAGIEANKRRRGRPAGSDKTQIALRVDNDTLAAFRATGQGWQSRMNTALGEWVKSAHG
jgi:uncharacterized protein (DUF4415 family)